MRVIYNADHVRQQLREKIAAWYAEHPGARRGGKKSIADQIGIDRRQLHDTIEGNTSISPKILTFLGLERKVVYVTPET